MERENLFQAIRIYFRCYVPYPSLQILWLWMESSVLCVLTVTVSVKGIQVTKSNWIILYDSQQIPVWEAFQVQEQSSQNLCPRLLRGLSQTRNRSVLSFGISEPSM